MKRTSTLRRKTRIAPRRAKPRRSERIRDVPYMLAVKRLPCLAAGLSDCHGPIEADHAGQRPMGRKADDATCIPLCTLHHRQRTDFTGPFRAWTRAQMRQWLDVGIRAVQRTLTGPGGLAMGHDGEEER